MKYVLYAEVNLSDALYDGRRKEAMGVIDLQAFR